MSAYFTYFPITSYMNVNVRDILKRSNFIEINFSNPYVFLPYTIKDGEKPEDIAFHYYGSVDHTWLITLSNSIVDPYHQWPLSEHLFSEFIMKKYETESGKLGYDIVAWTQSNSILENIKYYKKTNSDGKIIYVAPDTFPLIYDNDVIIGREVEEGYEPYRIYEYEQDLNESRREILIVDKQYHQQITKEFKKLMKQ